MRHPFTALTLILATVTAVTLVPEFARAQGKSDQAPPKAAPVKPYKPLAVTPPGPYTDPGFAAFRKQLGDVAQHKDRAALAKLVVAQGFFWDGEKGDQAQGPRSRERKPAVAPADAGRHDPGGTHGTYLRWEGWHFAAPLPATTPISRKSDRIGMTKVTDRGLPG